MPKVSIKWKIETPISVLEFCKEDRKLVSDLQGRFFDYMGYEFSEELSEKVFSAIVDKCLIYIPPEIFYFVSIENGEMALTDAVEGIESSLYEYSSKIGDDIQNVIESAKSCISTYISGMEEREFCKMGNSVFYSMKNIKSELKKRTMKL